VKAVREGTSKALRTYKHETRPWYFRFKTLGIIGTGAALILGIFSRKDNRIDQ
jgi:uncharacterized membrane protein YsdA (DUF1294 family)